MGVRDEKSPETHGRVAVEVVGLAAGGRGVGRVGGRVWLVEGAVPGDRVSAVPLREHSRFVEARVESPIEVSRLRRAPPCPIQATCGGCPWMVLDEKEKRAWKRRILEESLVRSGKLKGVCVEEGIASARSIGYRNKVEFTFGRDREGKRVLGLHASGASDRLVDVDQCLVQREIANDVLSTARQFFLEGPGREDPALRDRREPARLVLRTSSVTGAVLVGLRGAPGPFGSAGAFARLVIERHPEVGGVVRLLAKPGRRGGVRTVLLAGSPFLEEALGGNRFTLPASTFFQVNPWAAEDLVRLVVDLAGPVAGSGVLELYGGVGVFGLALAREGARVTIVEADPEAVACGREAARFMEGTKTRFVCGDARSFLAGSAESDPPPDVVIADPPRTGLGGGVARGISGTRAGRVVLVSCDPATLARDARILSDRGYELRRVVPVELFPQTANIEAVALFEFRGQQPKPSSASNAVSVAVPKTRGAGLRRPRLAPPRQRGLGSG